MYASMRLRYNVTVYKCLTTMSYDLGFAFFFHGSTAVEGLGLHEAARSPSYTTLGRILDEWSARRRGLFLDDRTPTSATSMPSVGFEPAVPKKRVSINTRL